MIVYPAFGVSSTTVDDFREKYSQIPGGVDGVHIDVGDGAYIPNKTQDLNEIDFLNKSLYHEVHLMVAHPAEYLDVCEKKPISRIIAHHDTLGNGTEESILVFQELVHERGMQFTVAFRVGEIPSFSFGFFAKIDRVMFMTVPIGRSGQNFEEIQLEVIRNFREGCAGSEIEVDGGINDITSVQVRNAGVDVIAVTSYLFSGSDFTERYDKLELL